MTDVTALPPYSTFLQGHPISDVPSLRGGGDKLKFWTWFACWVVVPNLPYLMITILGGPPRYPEIVMCGAVGLAVRRLPYVARLTAFAAMTCLMLASFVAHMFNMNLTMLMSVAPLFAGINPALSSEYVIGGALLLSTFAGASWLLRRPSDFTGSKWLVGGIGAILLLAAGDYQRSRDAMGSYSRLAPAEAPFSSATTEADLIGLADGKTNILLVMVEAMGEPRTPALRARFDRIWMRPELMQKYEISRGSTRFYGSTTSGEIRELCRRWGDYPEITKRELSCLPHILARRGYETTSFHPFHANFFERDKWYPLIGFQRSVFGKQLLDDGAQLCPNVFAGACDKGIPDRVARHLIGSAKPQFVYWLTLNSHLPIVENKELGTENCARLGGTSDQEFPMVCRLFAVWEDTADALLRTMARSDFPPTHVLVVGDHMPPLSHQRSRLLFDSEKVPWVLFRVRDRARHDTDSVLEDQ